MTMEYDASMVPESRPSGEFDAGVAKRSQDDEEDELVAAQQHDDRP